MDAGDASVMVHHCELQMSTRILHVYFSLAALLCLGSVYICKRKFSCSGKEMNSNDQE